MPRISKNAKPGVTPKALEDAVLGEEPSQLKNNIDQVLQPTREGGVAGGQVPPVGATGNEPPEQPPTERAKQRQEAIRLGEQANSRVDMTPKMVEIDLQRHYVPIGAYEIVGEAPAPALAGTGTKGKLLKGTKVRLTADEARDVLKSEIGKRAIDF